MLSIIIPTLNEEKYLPRILSLIRKQSFSDYEIIISDAFSEDQTLKIAEEYNCQIIVGSKERRHPAIQRNAGAKIARGDVLLFLDADTLFKGEDFLEKIYQEFKERKLGVAGFYLCFSSRKFFYYFYFLIYNSLSFLAQFIKPLAVGAGIIIKKDLHQKIKGFNESLFIGEDQDYCERASKLENFRLIKSKKIFFSIRRFEKEGPWRMFFKLVYSTLYVLIFGPIKKKIIKYDFGNH